MFAHVTGRALRLAAVIAAAATGAATLTLAGLPAPAAAHPGHGHILLYTEAPAGPWHDAAIAEATPKIKAALEAKGIAVTVDADSSEFTDDGLAQFDAIVAFQINGNPWTDAEKAALERWMAAGNGIAAVHNALDMRGGYAWWDGMVGSLMPGHAPTGTDPGPSGVVRLEDHAHPSTEHFGDDPATADLDETLTRWTRNDEWYNFSNNVRGTAHVLATMDETTYSGGTMGYDHPISWCKPYEGGRFWGTALGHFPSHYDDARFMQHLVGGVEYVAGLKDGDCGGTVWGNYERVPLDENTSAPYAIDVADDGRVFYTELVRGQLRMYDPATQDVTTVLTLPVYSGGEDGLLGVALHPDFLDNGHVFLYRSPKSANESDPANFWSVVSRFTMVNGAIDPATEKEIIRIPARREPDEPGHTGGGLDFDAQGNLYIGVGDDVNPHSEPSGGYAPLSERDGTFHDARATSANTNDLRGKLLRITPTADGSGYTIPEGNLFPEVEDAGRDKTLPEIYAMGFRNPFRFSVDQETGWVGMADYSPDNSTDAPATRGPAGIAEWNLIKSPGNYGWPLCMGDNEPFRDVDYRTSPVTVGGFFDCANPVNDSIRNTGLTNLPPARAADMFYGYKRSSVPSVIPQGGGLAPMGGPFYHYDEASTSDTKFPESWDDKAFFYEWARNDMYSIQLKEPAAGSGSQVEKVNPVLPTTAFSAPIDSKFGPDGSMYVLDWGGGFGRDNPNSGLYRVDYISGSRSPIADIQVDADTGAAPLTVAFDGSGSRDPEEATLAYAWDVDGDGTTDATGATTTHTYTEVGVYTARLTVTDPLGKTGTTTVPITVGNTRPSVSFDLPPNGSFFDFGDEISYRVEVSDPEDPSIDPAAVIVTPALGHDEHAHPLVGAPGLDGSHTTSLGGHAPDENIFYAFDARYTDGGANGQPPLTGDDTTVIFPKLRQAEWFDGKSSSATVVAGRDTAGGGQVVVGKDGAWIRFEPVNFHRIDEYVLRVQSTSGGGAIELRDGSPTGELIATAPVPDTGSQYYRDVAIDVSDLGDRTLDLYLVFTGASETKLNFTEAIGQGSSPASAPSVAITAPEQGSQFDPGATVTVTAAAADTDGDVTGVRFLVDGQSIGEDTTAPYSVDWTALSEEALYHLTAVATDDDGRTKTSRSVVVQVGELFGDLLPFTNVDGQFERLSAGQFRITGAGDDTWQGVDEYSALYQPAGGDAEWEAVVEVESHTMTNGAAKAGLIVRNDMTQPGLSPGYAMVALRPSGGVEFLTDPDGNGQLNASVQGGTSSTPKWLKLRRDTDGHSAYWSNDGTTWTQVGAEVALAGAAATQDVGFFEMSHEAAAKSATFSGFAIDTDPTGPPVALPSDPLTCVAGPVSDDFDDANLSAKWGLRFDPAKPITQSGGSLNLPVTTGDINEASTGPVSFAGQPVPAGNWTADAKITLAHSSHWQWAGLVVHQSDNEYNKLAFVRSSNGSRFLEFQTETAGTRTTHASPTLAGTFATTIHLRLINTGGTLTAAYSADGTTWTAIPGSTAIKSGAKLGVMAAGDLGTTPQVATVDSFTITPDKPAPVFEPDDEFDGTALDGCRWAQSVRYNSHTESVANGHLVIQTEPGDINRANPISPRNFVLQTAPEGDWVAEAKFEAPLKHRWQLAGLLMYGDDDNYAKADVVAYNNPGSPVDLRAELAAEKNGTGVAGGDMIDVENTTESGYWWIRVTKTGSQYSAAVKGSAGVDWTPIGDGLTYDGPLNALGLMAIGPQQEEPVAVEFDYFHLDPATPADTTAPTSSLTWAPAQPDGADGWYVTAPAFTVASDDGAGSGVAAVEFSLDGGATWTAYSAPVAVSGDGEHTVQFRATDEAGNVEAAQSASVKVDTVAPVTAATTAPAPGGVAVTLAAADETSGVARTEVSIDGGDWASYTEPVTVTGDGDHTVAYRSVDRAGVVETEKSVVFQVDATGPTIVVTGLADGATYGDAESLALAWSATDGSGVESTSAALDGQAIQPGTVALHTLALGAHTLEVRAVDTAGNTSTVTLGFTVDTSIVDLRGHLRRQLAEGVLSVKAFGDLDKILSQAEVALASGNADKARKALQSFVKTASKSVPDAAARALLVRDAEWVAAGL